MVWKQEGGNVPVELRFHCRHVKHSLQHDISHGLVFFKLPLNSWWRYWKMIFFFLQWRFRRLVSFKVMNETVLTGWDLFLCIDLSRGRDHTVIQSFAWLYKRPVSQSSALATVQQSGPPLYCRADDVVWRNRLWRMLRIKTKTDNFKPLHTPTCLKLFWLMRPLLGVQIHWTLFHHPPSLS